MPELDSSETVAGLRGEDFTKHVAGFKAWGLEFRTGFRLPGLDFTETRSLEPAERCPIFGQFPRRHTGPQYYDYDLRM